MLFCTARSDCVPAVTAVPEPIEAVDEVEVDGKTVVERLMLVPVPGWVEEEFSEPVAPKLPEALPAALPDVEPLSVAPEELVPGVVELEVVEGSVPAVPNWEEDEVVPWPDVADWPEVDVVDGLRNSGGVVMAAESACREPACPEPVEGVDVVVGCCVVELVVPVEVVEPEVVDGVEVWAWSPNAAASSAAVVQLINLERCFIVIE